MGYIDPTGAFVIKPQFDRAYPFSEGLAAVEVKNKSGETRFGFIERSGEFVVAPRFRLGFRFHDGICWTETRETSGYIDRSGEYVWQCPWVEMNLQLRL